MDWLRRLNPFTPAVQPQPAATFEGVVADLAGRVDRLRQLKPQPYKPGNLICDQLRDWFALHIAPKDIYDPWRIPRDGPKEDWRRLAAVTTPQRLVDLAASLLATADSLDLDPRRNLMTHALFMAPDMCRLTARTLCETATALAQRTGKPLAMPQRCTTHVADYARELRDYVANSRDGLEIAALAGR
jgi:hypothetical protein